MAFEAEQLEVANLHDTNDDKWDSEADKDAFEADTLSSQNKKLAFEANGFHEPEESSSESGVFISDVEEL